VKSDSNFFQDTVTYARRIFEFGAEDWMYYIRWVGLMMGLLFCTTGFVLTGWKNGVEFPSYVWNVPLGTFIFIGAIAFDTIGHQTAYKEALKSGERLVHLITIFAGVSSCIVLCLGYRWPDFFRIPALSLIALSLFYSIIDEWMHWNRFMAGNSDRIEMWSHFFIFLGHAIMILSWWKWFDSGYPGVRETLSFIPVFGI
jgi:hypothetical protein